MKTKTAIVVGVNDLLEHDFTIYNKSIFLGETATLIDRREGWTAAVLDISYGHVSMADVVTQFATEPDLILFWGAVNQSRLILRLAHLARKVCPEARLLVFGRATTFIAPYFTRKPFDAVHVSGDRESAIESYMEHLDGQIPAESVTGLQLVGDAGEAGPANPGTWMPPERWPKPDLSKLPLSGYMEAQARRKGIVDCRLGAAITASKGCETRCNFCGCSEEEGVRDRVRPVEALFEWIDENQQFLDDSFHLYSANILANLSWMGQMHTAYTRGNYKFTWQGVTRTNTLREEVTMLAAECGLRKLSIGIEHVNSQKERPLKSSLEELERAAMLARKHKINLVGLLMLGYPGQTVEDVRYILALLKRLEIHSFRFTGYTPLQNLRSMSVEELDRTNLEAYDRRTFFSDEMKMSPKQFYRILMSNGDCLK